MDEQRLKRAPRNRAPRVYRPVPRYNTEANREHVHVREFVRALTRFQPRRDTWKSDTSNVQSCVSDECRRLHRRENADFILSPRGPHSEFRPRSAHPDCKKEFVPKTNICFENPGHKISRRCIKSAPPLNTRSDLTPRSSGRFEHNILQDEYFELHTMLRKSTTGDSLRKDTVEDIVSRPTGVYSHQFPSTNHRIFCLDENVGMGYFKRFRNDLLDNLSLDINGIGKKDKDSEMKDKSQADDTAAILEKMSQTNVEKDHLGVTRYTKDSARSVSSCGSVSSFNSKGEVQIRDVRPNDNMRADDSETADDSFFQIADLDISSTRDVCTSTMDDKHDVDLESTGSQ